MSTENNVENNVPKMPARNGGELNAGGTPGNKGGTGRPPNEVRALASRLGYKALERFEEQLDQNAEVTNTDLSRMADIGLKYGIGTKVELSLSNTALMEIVGVVAAKYLSPEQFDAFLGEIEDLANGSMGDSAGSVEASV